MTEIYSYLGVVFEWDAAKAESNRAKHGVTFEEAAVALLDPFGARFADADHSQEEQRDLVLGFGHRRVLLVVQTERGESTRIISARSATKQERSVYESARR